MDNLTNPMPVQQTMMPSQKKNNTPIIIVAVLIILAVAGYFIFGRQKKTEEKKPVTVIESPTPSPTEAPKVDKKTVKIQVVNGTGTPGQAGEAVKALEAAGFEADNIKTGNADKYDNTTTSIQAKTGFEGTVSEVKDALSTTFTEITVKSAELDSTNEFDVVVVTGGKIFETPTSAVTPTKAATPTTSATTPSPTVSVTPTITNTPTPTSTP